MIEIVFPCFLSGRRGIALLPLRLFVGVAFLFHGYAAMERSLTSPVSLRSLECLM
jgi:hypothetical protein